MSTASHSRPDASGNAFHHKAETLPLAPASNPGTLVPVAVLSSVEHLPPPPRDKFDPHGVSPSGLSNIQSRHALRDSCTQQETQLPVVPHTLLMAGSVRGTLCALAHHGVVVLIRACLKP